MRRVAACATLVASISLSARADDPADLARAILDDGRPQAEREAIVRDHPALSDKLILAMTADLKPGTPEEDRRIPWIWRVAVAAGKRNEPDEVRRILDVALPRPDAPLDNWRAVVIGGGIVNGIGLANDWPAERVDAILGADEGLKGRWSRAVARAAGMADDESISTGTRYDALRMVAMKPWDEGGGQLFRYLLKGVHPELQQGAISGLGDVRSPGSAQALLSGFEHYSPGNRAFALDALLRDEGRVAALLDAVEAGRVSAEDLGPGRVKALVEHTDQGLRRRAGDLLSR